MATPDHHIYMWVIFRLESTQLHVALVSLHWNHKPWPVPSWQCPCAHTFGCIRQSLIRIKHSADISVYSLSQKEISHLLLPLRPGYKRVDRSLMSKIFLPTNTRVCNQLCAADYTQCWIAVRDVSTRAKQTNLCLQKVSSRVIDLLFWYRFEKVSKVLRIVSAGLEDHHPAVTLT